jgi:hypothetical protein
MAGIPRRAWIAVAIYVALLATLATSLYDPFETGEDDSWVIIVMLSGAHLAVGIAIARAWALMLPVVAAVVGFFASGGEALSWLVFILELPLAAVLTAIGWLIGRRLGPRAGFAAAPVFVLAALPTAAAAVETFERSRAPHVPATVQRQLPLDVSLGNLCPGAETPGPLRRDIERRAEVLLRELDRHPDWLVTNTYYPAESPDVEHRDITVRELAEEQLRDLKSGLDCRLPLRGRLEHALGA